MPKPLPILGIVSHPRPDESLHPLHHHSVIHKASTTTTTTTTTTTAAEQYIKQTHLETTNQHLTTTIHQPTTTMPHWPRLEATDSIIEVLWDVALLVFAIRLALIYAALTFTSSAVLFTLFFYFAALLPQSLPFFPSSSSSNINTNITNPFATHPYAAPCLALAAAAASAQAVIRRYDIPRVLAFRLAMGIGAGAVAAMVAGVLWLVGCEWFGGREGMAVLVEEVMGGWKTVVSVAGWFIWMPVVMMWWERLWDKGVGVVRKGKGERAADNMGEKTVVGTCDM
ncbi:hypothetical protein B0I37DRAFT_17721 [Chaetomium sp. MPI-CAGE-AT-0009]|nr:hypothetical protein B0I37DRAFT_17721 [Chaetomium sp. MPI-CAGE-AT-0009]